MTWSFVVVYLGIGAFYTAAVASADGKNPTSAEVGLAGGVVAGVFWPFAIVYVAVAVRASKKRSLSVLRAPDQEKP
jgi:hypothetical protein